MTDSPEEQHEAPAPAADRDGLEDLYGLSDALVVAVRNAIRANRPAAAIHDLILELHAADLADLLEILGAAERDYLVTSLGEDIDSEVLTHLDDGVRAKVVAKLDAARLAAIIEELESDDAVDLLNDLDPARQQAILHAMPAGERSLYEQGLGYAEDSAGRLMRREIVSIPGFWTVGQTIDYMRDERIDLPEDFYNIIIVSPAFRPVGLATLSRMLRRRREVRVADIMERDPKLIPVDMDQEDVAFLFRQYGLVETPVVDGDGRLVGAITVDDIVSVMDAVHEDDILKMGGVIADDFYADIFRTVGLRFSWLLVNLGTAITASLVIALFEETLSRMVALAILMPIVASMGGNAGTQTLTVAVRAMAVNELTPSNMLRIIVKETLTGGINGVIFALIVGLVAWLWFGDAALGGVIAGAMIVNLLVAGLAGAVTPILLDRLGQDPAIASAVFLTTITDVVGFFVFLGLASWVLL